MGYYIKIADSSTADSYKTLEINSNKIFSSTTTNNCLSISERLETNSITLGTIYAKGPSGASSITFIKKGDILAYYNNGYCATFVILTPGTRIEMKGLTTYECLILSRVSYEAHDCIGYGEYFEKINAVSIV